MLHLFTGVGFDSKIDAFPCLCYFLVLGIKKRASQGVMHQSIPAAPSPPPPPRGICPTCQSRGWRICEFCASRGPDICQPRGQPRAFDKHAVSSHASAKISPVGAFPCLPYAFLLLICISVFLHTNLGSSRILI